MPWTAVTEDPLSVDEVLARVRADEDGAVVLFLGVVRDHNDGRPVTGMAYEAYREMAEKVLSEIADEVTERWETDRVAVVHRLGSLTVGEASVAIAVSTPHRGDAYEASRYVIEEIKDRLPVWKMEHYEDGERRWVPGRRPGRTSRRDAEKRSAGVIASGSRASDEAGSAPRPPEPDRAEPVAEGAPASGGDGS